MRLAGEPVNLRERLPHFGQARFRARNQPRHGGGLAVRVDRDEKQLILDGNPDVYYVTPHYNGYPGVIISVSAIGKDELFERLEDAWLIQAPKRLAAGYVAQHER